MGLSPQPICSASTTACPPTYHQQNAGLGLTMYGMVVMFVHDGLVHRRFPVGPIADVPYLQRVASAHQHHHSDKFDGVPYGLFLGPEKNLGEQKRWKRKFNEGLTNPKFDSEVYQCD
ncbi:hypothetical protein CMV_013198 [Castanea mollissima]|uniref:beta-carotene 3-hydroxylase n=1 Tax=Castanea mollissima TaxID=60419 RepID=A0A8J4R8E3_9ROSI|nr:hypothetical protein CMV_013198 [Castanea mollissima]